LLILAGADVNDSGDPKWPPLILALTRGYQELAKLLLDRGAKINVTGEFGTTPLQLAAGGGYVEIVERLLAKRADVNARRQGGTTALIEAVQRHQKGAVDLLISAGADVNLKANAPGAESPLMISLERITSDSRQEGIAKSLVAKGADLNAYAGSGRTPLLQALFSGNLVLSRFLVEHGADVNAESRVRFRSEVGNKNELGMTPLHVALKKLSILSHPSLHPKCRT